jgi:hypothetical protein
VEFPTGTQVVYKAVDGRRDKEHVEAVNASTMPETHTFKSLNDTMYHTQTIHAFPPVCQLLLLRANHVV